MLKRKNRVRIPSAILLGLVFVSLSAEALGLQAQETYRKRDSWQESMLAKGHGEIQTYARHQTKRDRMAEIERNNIRALLVYGDESEGGQDRPGRRGNDRARAKGGKTEHER